MPRGTARALAALPLPTVVVLSPPSTRPQVPVEAAAKERKADGRTAAEGRRPVPASGGAVLASTAMVSILPASPGEQEHEDFGLGRKPPRELIPPLQNLKKTVVGVSNNLGLFSYHPVNEKNRKHTKMKRNLANLKY